MWDWFWGMSLDFLLDSEKGLKKVSLLVVFELAVKLDQWLVFSLGFLLGFEWDSGLGLLTA